MSSLNIESAVAAHRSWCRKLKFVINDITDGQIDADLIGDETHCVFGNWLSGSGGREYSTAEEFGQILVVHKSFHEAASEIVQLSHSGKRYEANSLIITKLEPLSHEILRLLNQMGIDSKRAGVSTRQP